MNDKGRTHESADRVVCGIRPVVDVLPLRVVPGVGDHFLGYSVYKHVTSGPGDYDAKIKVFEAEVL